MSPRSCLLVLVLFAPLAAGGVTTATRIVGGPGGFSSCGPEDPPTLCDGTTRALAEVRFTYDDVAHTLTLRVTNTSPVTAGVPNPVLTRLFFNTPPMAVTGLALVSQQGSGGAAPAWISQYDADLFSSPNPNSPGPFGDFSVQLSNGGSVNNGIANAAANPPGGPPGSAVIGPVTFVFDVSVASGSALTASTFANTLSQNAPQRQVTLAAHFQAGGPNEESGKLTPSVGCEPGGFMLGEPRIGSTITFVMTGAPGCHGCLVLSLHPGPTIFPLPGGPPLILPIGLPFVVIIPQMELPAGSVVTRDLQIPNEPGLVNVVIYGAVILFNPTFTQVEFSTQFSFRILP